MTLETALHSTSPARKGRLQRAVRDGMIRALPGIAILCFWQVASGRLIRENYISKPQVTGQELVLSYVFGVASGMLLGYFLGRAPRIARIVEPYLMAFYGIPKIALAPLFVIWFGIGIWSKVWLAGTMVFFLVFYNVFAGVRSVDRDMVNLALVLGANERQLGRQIYLPATAPFLLLGMRMAIPYAVIGVIVGEFTASTAGLGLFINYASSTYDPAGVFAGIFILLAFVMAMSAIATRIEHRILRWRPQTHAGPGDGN